MATEGDCSISCPGHFTTRQRTSVPIQHETGWDSELVWIRKKGKSLAPAENQKTTLL